MAEGKYHQSHNHVYIYSLYVAQALRKNLLEQISEAYPTETEAYRALRTASALVSVLEFAIYGQ